MRPQKVSVDVWKMILSTCSYLALAFAAWVFLKLVNACFWLPQHLRDADKLKEMEEEATRFTDGVTEENLGEEITAGDDGDKKND